MFATLGPCLEEVVVVVCWGFEPTTAREHHTLCAVGFGLERGSTGSLCLDTSLELRESGTKLLSSLAKASIQRMCPSSILSFFDSDMPSWRQTIYIYYMSQHMHALTYLREQAKQLQIQDEEDDDDSDISDGEMLGGDGDTLSSMPNMGCSINRWMTLNAAIRVSWIFFRQWRKRTSVYTIQVHT